MDQMDIKVAGVVTATGDGAVANKKFTITGTSTFAKGGKLTLKSRLKFSPSASADKNGVTTNMTDFGDMHKITNLDDFDLSIAKSTEIMGQACDLNLSMEKVGRGGASALTAKTNVENVGDVTITLAGAGHKGACPDDGQALGADMCRISVNLPTADIHKDLTASVDYDVAGKDANVRVGYKSGDVTVALRSAVATTTKVMAHTVNANYSGIEGIGIGIEMNDSGSGKLSVTKDRYELEVPVSKSGVNKDDIKLTMKWSMAM